MPVAFTTRAGLDSSSVGSIAVGDESYELHEVLDEGGGYIVVPDDNTLLQVILDEHPAMKRSTLKAAEEAAEKQQRKAARKAEKADNEEAPVSAPEAKVEGR
jgi:hypothetical protein